MKKRTLQSDSSECKGGGCDAFGNVIDDGASIPGLAYMHDDLSRLIARNDDVFAYNGRSEVAFAEIAGNIEEHAYDLSGNSLWASFNSVTNYYTANNLNQYTAINRTIEQSEQSNNLAHDADGNLITCGQWSYSYDSASQLVTASSNGVLLVTNQYDCRHRRVKKITPAAMHTFLYDDWNLIHERVDYMNGSTDDFNYYWGRDLSGILQGAGGVGGLLYVKRNGVIYIPQADANGNILRYTDTAGNIVAEYTYDAFGRAISQSGPLAGIFRHRFSSKYFDVETGLYYYGYRFYSPVLRRWLTRDLIEERGGLNLYSMCENSLVFSFDALGTDRYMTTFSANPTNDQWHVGVAVDTWKCSNGNWVKTGVATFDFGVDDSSFWNRLGTYFVTLGTITENDGNTLVRPHVIPSYPEQDIEMLRRIRTQLSDPPLYSFFFNNCIHWATTVIDYGIDK